MITSINPSLCIEGQDEWGNSRRKKSSEIPWEHLSTVTLCGLTRCWTVYWWTDISRNTAYCLFSSLSSSYQTRLDSSFLHNTSTRERRTALKHSNPIPDFGRSEQNAKTRYGYCHTAPYSTAWYSADWIEMESSKSVNLYLMHLCHDFNWGWRWIWRRVWHANRASTDPR